MTCSPAIYTNSHSNTNPHISPGCIAILETFRCWWRWTNWEVGAVSNKLGGGGGSCCVTSTDCLLSSPAIDPSIDTHTNRNPNEYKVQYRYVKLHQFTQIWIEIRQTTFHTTASEFVFAHQPCICIVASAS